MAVVTFNKKDLESLVGKTLTEKDYKEKIPMMGTPLEELGEDEVTFEVFPNRPDMLSVEGFARAVQGFLGITKGLPKYVVLKSDYRVKISRSMMGVRGCAAFAVVRGLKMSDEMVAAFMQLQEKLSITIGRRRKKASIGAYDLQDIKFPVKLVTKPAGFKFRPLGFTEELTIKEVLETHPKGQEFAHLLKGWTSYPLYMDAKDNVLSLLPITNAEFSKIRDDTKDMLIEVTGTDWKSVFEMLNITITALAKRGCKVYEVKTIYPNKVVTAPGLKPWKMELDPNYVNKLLDLNLKPPELKEALEKMRFGVSGKSVYVPPYRTDVLHPIDLVEDIAIAHGYEKFEPRIPAIATIAKANADEEDDNAIRNIVSGLGFQEIVTFVLSNRKKQFEMLGKKKNSFVEIQNPKTEDYNMARISLIPGLLETFSVNSSTEMPQRIFEVGFTVQIDEKAETGARNSRYLAAGIMHSNANYSEMKAYVDTFFTAIGKKFEISESKDSAFIPGRCIDIKVSGKKVGVMGEVSPKVLSNFGIEYPVVVFEVELEKV